MMQLAPEQVVNRQQGESAKQLKSWQGMVSISKN